MTARRVAESRILSKTPVSSAVPRTDGYSVRMKHLVAIFTAYLPQVAGHSHSLLSLQADEEPRWNDQARRYRH